VVLTQDGRQRASTPKYWTFTKYDDLNRPVLSGIKDTTALMTQAEMQNVVDAFYNKGWTRFGEQYVGAATGNVHGYTNKSYPIVGTGSTLLSVNPGPCLSITYYDRYDFKRLWPKEAYGYNPSDPSDPIHNLSQEVNGITYSLDANAFANVKGQVTGTKIKVLDGGVTGGNTWLRTAMYYDDHYRVIQTVGDNYKGGQDRVSNLYDFAGKVLKNLVTHSALEVSWTDLYNITTQGNRIIGTGASGWGNSGAASEQVLPAAQDGSFEFVATETTTHRMLGLSQQNTDANFGSIDYAFYLASTGIASVYLHGVSYSGVQAVSYKAGDTLRMVREGTSMKYYKNQSFLGSSSASSAALLIDGAFNTNSATLAGVRSSFSETRKIILRTFEYDHAGRLINTWHKIDENNPVLLAHNEYNELGQLVDKKIHATQSTASDALQSIDYAYNIRGWLTNINNASLTATGTEPKDYFGMNLNYQDNIAGEMGDTYAQGVSGLVSQYDLNGNANDQSPGKLDGTVTGAQLTSDSQGAANQAYAFNGTTDKIVIDGSLDKHSFIKNTGTFTLSAYIKLSDMSVRSTIIGNTFAATTKGFSFSFEGASSRRLRFVITAGQATYFQAWGAANTIHDGNWHHVAVTGDGKVVRFYVDGMPDGTPTSITLLDNGDCQFPTCIGNDYDANGDINTVPAIGMRGALDEIKIYDHPLSPTEILTLTQHASPGVAPASSPYNGNISSIQWSVNQGLSDVKKMAYTFQYDPMNRLLSANHFKSTGTNWQVGTNNEGNLTYDLQGNIKTLSRYNEKGSLMDFLTYNYTNGAVYGNQLLSLGDKGDVYKGFLDGVTTTAEYTYDQNGNMVTDQNKGIGAIAYNYLNLPELVTRGANTVRYIYDAGGRKLSQLTTFTKGQQRTDYMGEFQYENNVLQSIQHEEGRAVLVADKTFYTGSGESIDDITTTGTTTALVTLNGNEKYVEVASDGTASGNALFGGVFRVVAGERYKIRVKGYYTLTSPVYIIAKYTTANSSTGNISWPGTSLPGSAATESWAEQTILIPADANQLQIGISWNTVTGLPKAYVNEIELIQIKSNATPEYQYNLKDHLGNVRLTFTTKAETETTVATLEDNHEDEDRGNYLYYDEAIKVKSTWFDHTNNAPSPANNDGTNTGWGAVEGTSTRLTNSDINGDGHPDDQNGLARSISVMPGDVVNMEVWAKYLDLSETPENDPLVGFISYIGTTAAATSGTIVDGGALGSLGNGVAPSWLIDHSDDTSDDEAPKAYLNYIFLDRDMNPVSADLGFKKITEAGKESGQDGQHDQLTISYTVKQPGYLYIYVSNDNPTPVEVYFDDFKVEHIKSPVIQTEDYYPFGLTFNSYSRENGVKQDYQFNGKELQDELNLGWLDYGARMYMADIGRWGTVDPLADKFYPSSPYSYVLNNPVNLIDPDGRSGEAVVDEKNKTVTVNMVYVFYGSGATQEDVDAAVATLNKMWNANADEDGWSDGGDGWKVQVNATGVITDEEGAQQMSEDNEGNALFNYVRVEEQNNAEGVTDPQTGETDHKVSHQDGNSGFWINRDMKDTTPAHESGHGLNLSNAWHDNAQGIMVPGTDDRKVNSANLTELRSNAVQGQDKSSLVDKYLFNVKRTNVGGTNTTIYDKDGYPKTK
jgi:RHS repeat-associated protein